MDSARIWSQSVARGSLMGRERTHNPSPAAASMLGKGRVKRAKAKLKRKGRKSAHRGNPLPAVVGLLGGLGSLGGRFRKPSEVRAAAVAPSIIAAANGGNLTAAAGLLKRAATPMLAKEHAVWVAAAAQIAPDIVAAVKANAKRIPAADQSNPENFAQSIAASPFNAPGSEHEGAGATLLGFANTRAGSALTTAVVRGLTRRPRRRGYGGYGRRRRSSYDQYDEGDGGGGGIQAGIPSGAASRFASVGKVAGVAAAGAAAYLVTHAVLKYLGGRALAKEQAGVAATLALREARDTLAQQQGKPLTKAQSQAMSAEWKRQLIGLGYDPVTFTRTRSKTEQFLSDYNPED